MKGTVNGAIWFAGLLVAVGLPVAAWGQAKGRGQGHGGMAGVAMADSGTMAGMADGAMSGEDDEAMDPNMARHMDAQLDARVPLGIARWHEHVNWCLPRGGLTGGGLEERRNGQAVFGPEPSIATQAACDAVGGVFHPLLFNWMVHLDVFQGNDLKTIFQIM